MTFFDISFSGGRGYNLVFVYKLLTILTVLTHYCHIYLGYIIGFFGLSLQAPYLFMQLMVRRKYHFEKKN